MRVAIGHIKNDRASGVLYEERADYCTTTDTPVWLSSIRSFAGRAPFPLPGDSAETFEVSLGELFPGVTGRARIAFYERIPNSQPVFHFESVGRVEFSAECGLVMDGKETRLCR